MVLKVDNINQTMLIPTNLKDLIPKDHPCYFIKNVVDSIDFKKIDSDLKFQAGQKAYPRQMLLRLVLMSVYDGGLSSREIERKVATDISYMYLAGMEKPDYRTIARFKENYSDLITKAFKQTIILAEEENLLKIHHISFDGTKIKGHTSINKLTNKKQLKILEENLKHSIELDNEEDLELGEESGNKVTSNLSDPENFKKLNQKINETTENNKNQNKLRSTGKKILNQAQKSPENTKKALEKVKKLQYELEKSGKDVIAINDPEAHFMKNKKGNWEFGYNGQVGVDNYKNIIVSVSVSQNPTDHHELIPQIEQLKENIGEIPEDLQISADNGYSTDSNTDYLEEQGIDAYISTRKLSRKQKKIKKDNKFFKDNFTFDLENDAYICPEGKKLNQKRTYNTKNSQKTVYWTNKCKNCTKQLECCGKHRYRTITDYGTPSKIRMLRKMETPEAQEAYKIRGKTVELVFGNFKRNMNLLEFSVTGLEKVNTEFTLYATGHNLKRIYNEIQKQNKINKTFN